MISCIASRKIIQTEAIMREKLTFFFVISTICLIFAIELVNKETFCQLVRGNQVRILNCSCSCKPLFMGQAFGLKITNNMPFGRNVRMACFFPMRMFLVRNGKLIQVSQVLNLLRLSGLRLSGRYAFRFECSLL